MFINCIFILEKECKGSLILLTKLASDSGQQMLFVNINI